ncbi:hypothetical protein FocTR4_00013586 [Fusarium oxysporum f. sp. cubense]|uniref:Protein kinase domain-containing protein n=1 Tax=Fusarium oxysporum f. sp. cubense TaxID=61366 RepID=A0A5C6SM10_FUSOC|nr:hypothetical protein FocTR4_00013586 [Fusarium oxysporum f. sp. cubense]
MQEGRAALETFDDAVKAVSDLEVCHLRLVFWLIASGTISARADGEVNDPVRPPELMQQLYPVILSQFQDDFAELQTIFARYKFPVTFAECSLVGEEAARPSVPWTVDSIRAVQGQIMAKLKQDMSYHRKVKFQTMDKKRVEDILSRLSKHLDSLFSSLSAAGRLQWDVEDRIYTLSKVPNKPINELLVLAQEARFQGEGAHAARYMTVATFKQAKEEYLHHMDAQRGLRPVTRYSTYLGNAILELDAASHPAARQLGKLRVPGVKEQSVMVEMFRKKDRGGLVLIQQAEVNLLCSLLSGSSPDIHPDLQVLQCLGHLTHPTDMNLYALVFALPQTSAISMPVTLQSLLLIERKTPERLPTLESRLSLAIRLTKAVWRIHHYGWFHKCLSSSNILYFPSSPGEEPEIARGFFLAGFDNMRLQTSLGLTNTASAADMTSRANFYRHPAFLGGVTDFDVVDGYAPAFDLWSLGVILCEIAMWAPVDSGKFVRSRSNTNKPEQMAQIFKARKGEELYPLSPISELAHRMGTGYERAVVNCFAAGDNAKEPRWVAENIIRSLIQSTDEQAVLRSIDTSG